MNDFELRLLRAALIETGGVRPKRPICWAFLASAFI